MRELLMATLLIMSAFGAEQEELKDFSTSLAKLELLIATEARLIDTLWSHAGTLGAEEQTMRSIASWMRIENEKAQRHSEQYLAVPLNGYRLVRSLHSDWKQLEIYLRQAGVGEPAFFDELHRLMEGNMPSAVDLQEATMAMYRLQTMYDLKVTDMARGVLNGIQYDARLLALDCYAIAKEMLRLEYPVEAGYWAYEALGLFMPTPYTRVMGLRKVMIYELYADILLQQDRQDDVAILVQQAIDLEPQNEALLARRDKIQQEIRTNRKMPKMYPTPQLTTYELACRGAYDNIPSRLHCRYNSTTSAFLRLAPLKMEELSLEPYVVLFHEVVSDAEIRMLKAMARPHLERATVFDEGGRKSEQSPERTSQFAWFLDGTNDVTVRLNNRIADMTGFELNGSELLQVMNYGLGGHYHLHFDFFGMEPDDPVVAMNGDRICTVLFYLSEVEQGGATVFPYIPLAVRPRKGSAIAWYNLGSCLEPEPDTLHAACPVIVGNKWVCNKWIRSKAQLFRRLCNPQ